MAPGDRNMDSTPIAATNERPAVANGRSIFWPWPYAVATVIIGLSAYSFFRLSEAPAIAAMSPGGYSAIAYSHATGEFGSASDCGSVGEAEHLALSRCQQKDARVVVWCQDAWCALAVDEHHDFGFACSRNREEAERDALAHCREHSKFPCHVAVAVGARGTVTESQSPPASGEHGGFGAIAYSRSTGLFGSARDCQTLAEAERIALSGCNAPDAKVVIWAHNAWCALAVADDRAYGFAWGHSEEQVKKEALEHCSQFARTPYHIAVVVDH